jgi:hypothetical protein
MTTHDDALLREIARQGGRRHLLWELAADGRDLCGVEFTRSECDMQQAADAELVERFIADVDAHISEHPGGVSWDYLESTYGDRADEIAEGVAR